MGKEVIRDTIDARSSLELMKCGTLVMPEVERQFIEQIKVNMRTLSFIERRGLHSYGQINRLYEAAYGIYNNVVREIAGLEKEVARLEETLSVKEKLDSLENKLSGEKENYKNLVNVEVLLEKYRKQHEKNGLNISEDIGKLQNDIAFAMERIQSLKPQIEKCSEEIAGFEQCVRTLNRIDKKNGGRNENAINEFYNIRKQERYIEESRTEPPQREMSRGYER